MATATAVDSSSAKSSSADFDSWYDKTKAKVLDLNMSDDALIKFVSKEFGSTSGSADKRNALQQLVELRAQISTGMSNIIKVLSETARYVINNFRS